MLKKYKKVILFIPTFFLLLSVFVLPKVCSAQDGVDAGLNAVGGAIQLGADDPRVIAGRVIQVALGFLGIIAVGLIIYGGYLWMTSAGNEDKVTQAKTLLRNAVIGLVIILMSFAIASFVINQLLEAIGTGGGGGGGGGGGRGGGGGIGNLGACALQSVYPEHMQEDIPMNAANLIVTFREEIDPASICDKVTDGKCAPEAKIIPKNIRIFKNEVGDSCGSDGADCAKSNVTDVYALSKDNKTFVFVPVKYLGSLSEIIWYRAYLSNDILTKAGEQVFANCATDYFEWKFEVSNRIDLDPPQVLLNSVFPLPDNEKDQTQAGAEAKQATGKITVNSQPNVYQAAGVENPVAQSSSAGANIRGNYNCSESGIIFASISADMKVSVSGVAGVVGGDSVSDQVASLGCGLELTPAAGSFVSGHSWKVAVRAEQDADTLKIDNVVYDFVQGQAKNTEISLGADKNATAQNITNIINANHGGKLIATINGGDIALKAVAAGSNGNQIALETSNSAALALTPLHGGLDAGDPKVNDQKDQPMNTVIQINFNETMFPLTVSGDSQQLASYIKVKCLGCTYDERYMFKCDGENCLKGTFLTSNQYKTVEFISNNKCYTNGCGQDIFCLPGNSNVEVDINAAKLFKCADNNDCVPKSPYATCANQICQNENKLNYPSADILEADFPSGTMDIAFNSLDGNRNNNAQGQAGDYSENLKDASKGDNYKWSFYINDKAEIAAPVILSTYPAQGATGINLSNPLEINFNKIMMSSSLTSGSIIVQAGENQVEHKLINLWSLTNSPLGYWVNNEISYNAAGLPDFTKVIIKHGGFGDLSRFKAQVGSGVKDIYQNCYLPSAGPNCAATTNQPSCCSGLPVAAESCE